MLWTARPFATCCWYMFHLVWIMVFVFQVFFRKKKIVCIWGSFHNLVFVGVLNWMDYGGFFMCFLLDDIWFLSDKFLSDKCIADTFCIQKSHDCLEISADTRSVFSSDMWEIYKTRKLNWNWNILVVLFSYLHII